MRCKRQSKHSRAGWIVLHHDGEEARRARALRQISPAGSVDEDLQSVRSTSVWSRGLLTVTPGWETVDLDVPLPLDS